MLRWMVRSAFITLALASGCAHYSAECRAQINDCLKRCTDMGRPPGQPTSQEGYQMQRDSRSPCEDRCYNSC